VSNVNEQRRFYGDAAGGPPTTEPPPYYPPPQPQHQYLPTQPDQYNARAVGYQNAGPREQSQPSAYWPLSIIGLLFNWICGGIAVYYSSQVSKLWMLGDVEGSRKASGRAMVWAIVGIVTGLLFVLLVLAGSSGGSSA
jgi:Interferon-induced transmembrane protein